MAVKFSQFNQGGPLETGDIPVGLQNANNAQFTYVTPGGILAWNGIFTNTQMVQSNGYYIIGGGNLVLTLPLNAMAGSIIRIAGYASTSWKVAQNAGQQMIFESATTTLGTGGFLASTNAADTLELLCVVSNVTFLVIDGNGNISYV